MPIQLYSQRDKRWAEKKLGRSSLTVGRYGCTTSATASGLTAFGFKTTPADLAAQPEGYTPEGLVDWGKWKLPGTFKFKWRQHGRKDALIKASLASPDEFVILQVANGSHWVLATSVYGKGYMCVDPWGGDRCDVLKRYGNITGSAHFTRK